jgi:cell wall-associated NlpC family hydrolase
MKKLFLLLLFISAFGHAQVVTSKKEAIRKGLYEPPKTSQSAVSAADNTAKITSKPAAKKARKKIVIDDSGDDDLVFGPSENYLASQMINNAMEFIGVHYRGGGTTRSGMDCSGMVTAVFNIFGLSLPRSSHDMAHIGEKVARADIRKGDLIFFHTNGKKGINHVGMVIEANEDEIKFIHSSTQQGVIISSTKEPYYRRTFAQVNRVLM